MRRRPVLGLIAGSLVLAGLRGAAAATPPAGFLGRHVWRMEDPLFGGVSAIHVFPGGQRFLALTDSGAFTRGRLIRDRAGRIAAVEAEPWRLLRGEAEAPLREGRRDSESLAVTPDGAVHVGFEGAARVLRYAAIDGPAKNLPVPPSFRAMQRNSALEALAAGPDGTLYALPERSGAAARPFPVWRYRGGAWDQPFALPRRGPFLAVGADVGPDGRLYLLERAFFGLGGFASRLRRWRLSGGGVEGEEVVVETGAGTHFNLEGLSVWRDGAGLVATLVGDNNYRLFLPTEIVEYRLPD